jgi:F0F1-type ATP synthase beta subunit
MKKTYRVETDKFVVSVDVDRNGVIVHAAPIVRRFIGQPFTHLEKWCNTKFKNVKIESLYDEAVTK